MADLLEQANEIQESLGRSYAVPDDVDEADLEAGPFSTVPNGPRFPMIDICDAHRIGGVVDRDVRGRGARVVPFGGQCTGLH